MGETSQGLKKGNSCGLLALFAFSLFRLASPHARGVALFFEDIHHGLPDLLDRGLARAGILAHVAEGLHLELLVALVPQAPLHGEAVNALEVLALAPDLPAFGEGLPLVGQLPQLLQQVRQPLEDSTEAVS